MKVLLFLLVLVLAGCRPGPVELRRSQSSDGAVFESAWVSRPVAMLTGGESGRPIEVAMISKEGARTVIFKSIGELKDPPYDLPEVHRGAKGEVRIVASPAGLIAPSVTVDGREYLVAQVEPSTGKKLDAQILKTRERSHPAWSPWLVPGLALGGALIGVLVLRLDPVFLKKHAVNLLTVSLFYGGFVAWSRGVNDAPDAVAIVAVLIGGVITIGGAERRLWRFLVANAIFGGVLYLDPSAGPGAIQDVWYLDSAHAPPPDRASFYLTVGRKGGHPVTARLYEFAVRLGPTERTVIEAPWNDGAAPRMNIEFVSKGLRVKGWPGPRRTIQTTAEGRPLTVDLD